MGAAWWQDLFARLPEAARGALARVAVGPEAFRTFVASLAERPSVRNQLLVGGLAPEAARRLLSPALRARVAGVDPYVDLDALLEECPSADPIARLVHRFCRSYLAGQNLANADRASMANALELRAPFLDHKLVELCGRIPPSLRMRGLRGLKRLLKDALADRLPAETLRRGKQGFTAPLAEWFRGPLRATLCDILDPARVAAGGLLDAAIVDGLLRAHLAGRADHGAVLWSLATLEAWRRSLVSA
jgi:asparagine synthase (glutamine-hydrolysing)